MPDEGGMNLRMLMSDIMLDPSTAAENGFKFQPEKFPG
jgi:hypothetical protein